MSDKTASFEEMIRLIEEENAEDEILVNGDTITFTQEQIDEAQKASYHIKYRLVCPVCGADMEEIKCKQVCARPCGYMVGCSE